MSLPPLRLNFGQRLMPISRTSTTARRDGAAPNENITLMQTRSFESALPLPPCHAPRTLRRECHSRFLHVLDEPRHTLRTLHRERRSRFLHALDEPLATSPRTSRHIVGIPTELAPKNERDSDVDKASKHAVSEVSVEDAGFLFDSSKELFARRQAITSFNSETSTPSITPIVSSQTLTDYEPDKHSKTPTPPVKPRMACRSLTQEEATWDTTKHRMVGCARGQSYRQRQFNR